MVAEHGVRPVLVIGMHRSGTTMLTQMLEGLGLFVGQKTDNYDEAHFFAVLNRWLFRQSGATWQTPEPIQYLLTQAPARTRAVRHLQQAQPERVFSYRSNRALASFADRHATRLAACGYDERALSTVPLSRPLCGTSVAGACTSKSSRHAAAAAHTGLPWERYL